MIKTYLSLVLLLFPFFSQLNAQTIKNIHRHNLQVIQIPVDLIDKVETIYLNGVKTLQISPLFGEITQVPVSEIDSITHYTGSVNIEQLGELRTISVMGVVRDNNDAPVLNAIVRSPYGGQETRTDPNGVFFLNEIVVYDKLGYITITKPGFHKASRSFLPHEQGSNRVNIQLLPMTLSGSFSSANGGIVNSGLLQVNFPANSIIKNGLPFNGTVRVYAQALDPSSAEMFDQMPGDLLGGMNDSLRLLRSFGMASIELRDAAMNKLQLADGASATLTFNIPSALQADAPETIDWWSFDEALGYWKHEGEAQKTGTQYIGSASHFSWWNVDVPEDFNDFHGSINTAEGTPISDALVNLISPTMGYGSTYSNNEGVFSGRVPKNQSLFLNVFLICDTLNDWSMVHYEEFESLLEPIEINVIASLIGYIPVTGTVVNCDQVPVASGYLIIGSQIYFVQNGIFSIQTCSIGTYLVKGIDTSNPDLINTSDWHSVLVGPLGGDAGELFACLHEFGILSDVDGNVYPTVKIGNKWWMAENLKTAHFADGAEITNSTDIQDYSQISASAWYSYNSTYNDSLYGKLYNWYTTVDTRNLCPTGWHVPSTAEWTSLVNYLGGEYEASDKMKALHGWPQFFGQVTNESGFSGLPSGYLFNNNLYLEIGYSGYWWSTTGIIDNAYSLKLDFNQDE
ncbi:MAG: FISUMP domain-containing protein, partial [Bacteroidia bacterium]